MADLNRITSALSNPLVAAPSVQPYLVGVWEKLQVAGLYTTGEHHRRVTEAIKLIEPMIEFEPVRRGTAHDTTQAEET